MTFEELLKSKMGQIQGVVVYPLTVPKDARPPYIVYQKGPIDFRRSLDGSIIGADGEYNIVLITAAYDGLSILEASAIEKLLSLKNAEFGEYVVDDAAVKILGNFYIEQTYEYRSDLKLTFSY